MRTRFLLLIFLLPLFAKAQDSEFRWGQFGLNGGIANARGDFHTEYSNPMITGSLDIFFGFPDINSLAGLQIRSVGLGTEHKSIDDTTYVGNGLYALGLDSEAKTSINVLHLGSRFIPWKEAIVSPYIDLSGGIQLVDYQTSIRAEFKNGWEDISDNEESKVAMSYGLGLGLFYRINKNFLIDVRAQYYGSTRVRYPVMDDLSFDSDGQPYVKTNKSTTDMLIFSVGVVLYELNDG